MYNFYENLVAQKMVFFDFSITWVRVGVLFFIHCLKILPHEFKGCFQKLNEFHKMLNTLNEKLKFSMEIGE